MRHRGHHCLGVTDSHKIQLNWDESKDLKLSKTPEVLMQRKVDQLLQQYESVFS